jgi:hypothetical protein
MVIFQIQTPTFRKDIIVSLAPPPQQTVSYNSRIINYILMLMVWINQTKTELDHMINRVPNFALKIDYMRQAEACCCMQ